MYVDADLQYDFGTLFFLFITFTNDFRHFFMKN